jgi:predicted MFS family arabinose efflux permease
MRPTSRVRLGILLTAVMVVSNLVQFALGALGPLLVEDLGVSRADFGLLVTAYYLVAAVASVLVGGWIGRAGARRGIAALLGLGVLAGLALAAAPSYAWLFPGLILGGLVSAMSNPATNLALTTVSGRRGGLVGLKQSGVQGGALLAGLLLPPVGLMWGWQAGFLVCAGLALVCLAGLGAVQSNDPPAGTAVWGRLDRGVVRLAGYALFMGAGMTNVATYIVLYAHEQVGLGAQLAGWLLAVIGVAAVVARTGWSVLAERTGKSVHNWLLGTMAVSAVVATGLVALAQVAGPGLLWLAAAIAGLSGAAWNGVVMLLVILDAPPDRTAIASGQVQAAFFFGLCASPPIFGLLVDRFDSYPVGWAWTAACFAAAALIPGLLTRHDDP